MLCSRLPSFSGCLCRFCGGNLIGGVYWLWVGGCPTAKLALHAASVCIVNQPVKNDLFRGNSAVSQLAVILI